ncbi:MAG: alpha/beta fold hydrolase [Bacteroidota bacterium]
MIRPRAMLPLALAAGLVASGCSLVGAIGTSPYPRHVGAPPANLNAETVTVPVRARPPLAGWFVDAEPDAPAVVLLHGHTDTRRQMLSRARLLADEGYAVLLVDLPAHGESAGDAVTFGRLERFAASAAVDWVRQRRPGTRVGVLGISLGGASAALAGRYLDADALVMEGAFSTFERALRNRARFLFGPLAPPAEAVLVGQVREHLSIPPDSLRPVEALARTSTPTFVIGGSDDRYTTAEETRALYAAAPDPKEVWIVEGAKHEDFLAHAPETYRQRVLAFLATHLR